MKKPETVENIKEETIEYMKFLGTYRKEYETTIQVYADTVNLYQQALFELEKEESKFIANGRKNPFLTAITELRRDVTRLSNELMLTPRTNEVIVQETVRTDPSEKAIDNLEEELTKELIA